MKHALYLIFVLVIMSSCVSQKKFAYDFVNKSKGAEVAFYMPERLMKDNIREDCQPENMDDVAVEDVLDVIEARTKIVNKIDDEKFLDILISSFEATLKDYDLSLVYWEDERTAPDSLHWVVDMSHIEVLEYTEYVWASCAPDTDYEILPAVAVNVAAWLDLINGDRSNLLFTEQNLYEQIEDCYYALDTVNNIVLNAEYQYLTIEDFYDFAVVLGKLYAGYTFDYFMNEYIKKEFQKRGMEYPEDTYLRYDPYEMYIYYTRKDKLVKIN